LRELYTFEETQREIERLLIQKQEEEEEERIKAETEMITYLDELITEIIKTEEDNTIKIAFF
jgi:hypothetical protein